MDSFHPQQCSRTICTLRLLRQSTSSNHRIYPMKLHFTSNAPLDLLSPCTKRTSVSEVRLAMHALFQRLQRYGAIANIALVNLTDPSLTMLMYHLYAPLASSVHIVQSSQCALGLNLNQQQNTSIYTKGQGINFLCPCFYLSNF